MVKALKTVAIAVALVFLGGLFMESFAPAPAYAQVRSNKYQNEGSTFLQRLFGLGTPKKTQPKATRKKRRKVIRRKKRTPPAAVVQQAPTIQEEPKDEDAKTLLVVGDNLAWGLADGLKAVYAQTPSIKVKKLVYPKIGLVNNKTPDWPEDVANVLASEDVGLVVITLGATDDTDFQLGEEILPFQTRDWTKEYRYRVASLVAAVRNEQLPMIWLGLAPAEDYAKSANFSFLNDLFIEQVDPAGGIFVDVWKPFLDENGLYTNQGPDVDGKRRRLRANDGVYFTWAGYRKLAYFVEREIARVFGSASAFIFEGVKDDPNFVVLTGRLTSPEVKLIVAGEDEVKAVPGTAQHALTVSGDPLPVPSGRADDARWPPY
ncbi:DUF459 domain-containing protein [Rhodobacteraceae bacterium RKSG542]|uniref:SGNH/GDSL hydrolase family protein n=1 Tax=Pseudovibrio flavus TaxID=2529854 RepID=UPI0012BC78D8|nr:DUF459 domain-containing protein [Pseudovibrio flavus]MTI16922.1 DUF459 domain-containing protein [Pseudovibrio flavus]